MTDNITTLDGLGKAISILEIEKEVKEQQLKTQFNLTLESLNPINILKNSIRKKVASPNLVENIVGAALGISSGFALKRFVVRGSANIFRRLFGTLLQVGTVKLLADKSHALKLFGRFIFSRFSRHKQEKAKTL